MRLLALPLASIAAVACAGAPQSTAIAAEPADAVARTITVTGEGEATATPDLATIQIGVQTEGATAADALRANADAMTATIAKLKAMKIAAKDIQTAGLSVSPRYNYDKARSEQKLIGYAASNSVTVRVREIAKTGAVIDAAVASGANALNGVSFGFAQPKPLYDEARVNAVREAKARAKLLTDAADVKLGALLSIQGGYASGPSPRPVAALRAESAPTPIEAGEASVSANVTLVYAIE